MSTQELLSSKEILIAKSATFITTQRGRSFRKKRNGYQRLVFINNVKDRGQRTVSQLRKFASKILNNYPSHTAR